MLDQPVLLADMCVYCVMLIVLYPLVLGPGRGPASIFDRKRAERSQYLKSGGPTIQKAYGEGVHK